MIDEEFKFIKPGEVRTRFAPAPTGFLHIGGTRTALFNYLFVKKYQGSFILRIEDTDLERSKPEYERDILDSLKWLGIEWDEGPIESQKEKGKNQKYVGDYGPYRQSERLEIYAKYLKKLLDEKKAYYCFCSEEEIEAQRQYLLSIGEAPRYSGKCAQLSEEEVEKYLAEGKKSVIRFRMPAKKLIFEDLIRGKLEFDSGLIGDIVIAKNLTYPLYNFACVIDDFEMRISYVIRGEEHLSNTPKQILLQEALGFPKIKYAHLPLILGPDRSKLSKRHGAVAIRQYKKEGYLPEALINFMAFLGWNPGGEREIYSLPSLIKEFSMDRIQRGGAIFNIKRLDFLNGFYIRQRSPEKLTELCLPYLVEAGLIQPASKTKQYPPAYGAMEIAQVYQISETKEEVSFDYLKKIVSIYQERLKKISEISELTDFFFKEKLEYEVAEGEAFISRPRFARAKELLRWDGMTDKEIKASLDKLEKILSKIKEGDWNKESLETILMPEAENFGKEIKKPMGDRGYLLWPLRVALTGKKASAGPFEIAEILGKEKTLKRIREAKELIK